MQKCVFFLLFLPFTLSAQIFPAPGNDQPRTFPAAGVGQGIRLGHIPSLERLARQYTPQPSEVENKEEFENDFPVNAVLNAGAFPAGAKDPLAATSGAPRPSVIIPGPAFDGLRDPNTYPPDPVCAVGRHHVMQMTNGTGNGSWMQIWDKNGNSVLGPFKSAAFWEAVGGQSIGDPVVLYDAAADRWVFIELAGFYVNELVLAISDGADPTAGWTGYRFQTFGFADYPKLYNWTDAYLITANEITDRNLCSGYTLEKAALLNGSDYFQLQRFELPTYAGVQFQPPTGAGLDGGPLPPPGSPAMILRMYDDAWNGGADHLEMWEITTDWQNPQNSSVTGPLVMPVAPFESTICYGWLNCLDQPDPLKPRITALDQIIMFRAPYRNFGDYESIVLNHLTDVSDQRGPGGQAALRWYELRRTGSNNWNVYQQGTYAPDGASRFMNTIAQDALGNIATGYSVVSDTLHPGLRLTARRRGDAPGAMTLTEHILANGVESHTTERWGDYSALVVDPVDQQTFWFTGQYQPADVLWGTWVGAFTIRRDERDIAPSDLLQPRSGPDLSASTPLKVAVHNYGETEAAGAVLEVWRDGNLWQEAGIGTSILPGDSVHLTLPGTLDLSEEGRFYHFTLITRWPADQFPENDTLEFTVQHRPAVDVAVHKMLIEKGFTCSNTTTVGISFKNEGIEPVTEGIISYTVNGTNVQTYPWNGNLLPGALDTVYLDLNGLAQGENIVAFELSFSGDARAENNHLEGTVNALLDGSTVAVVITPWVRNPVRWEIQDTLGNILGSGVHNSFATGRYEVCLENTRCYVLYFSSPNGYWQGSIELYDLNEKQIDSYEGYVYQTDSISFCTPVRFSTDVAVLYRLAPANGFGLSQAEPVRLAVRNAGLLPVNHLYLGWREGGGSWFSDYVPVALAPGQVYEHTFSSTMNASLPFLVLPLEFSVTTTGDQQLSNNIRTDTLLNWPLYDLQVLSISQEAVCDRQSGTLLRYTYRNNGLLPLFTLRMEYEYDGAPVERFGTFFPALKRGDTLEIWQAGPPLKHGVNNTPYRVSRLNNEYFDQLPLNDSGTLSIEIDTQRAGISLNIFLDNKPAETRWELRDADGQVIDAGDGYTQSYAFIERYHCLARNQCYTLRIYDSAGNGFSGYVDVYYRGIRILDYNGGGFTDTLDLEFCTEFSADCGDLLLIGTTLPAATDTSTNGAIGLLPLGGTPPYTFILNNTTIGIDSVFSGLKPGIYTVTVRDDQGCERTITLEVGIVSSSSEPFLADVFQLSPNPAERFIRFSVKGEGMGPQARAVIYDTAGKTWRSFTPLQWDGAFSAMVDISGMPAGRYVLAIESGTRVWAKWFIKN